MKTIKQVHDNTDRKVMYMSEEQKASLKNKIIDKLEGKDINTGTIQAQCLFNSQDKISDHPKTEQYYNIIAEAIEEVVKESE